MEKMTKRSTDLQTATNNARLLAEMAAQYDRSSSGSQDRELMKVVCIFLISVVSFQ